MENNPIRFGQCCDKCGRPKMSCVCVQKITVDKTGNGIDGKGISELLKQKRYSKEEVIKLIQYAMQYAQDRHMDYPHTYWDEWIENNVK